VPTRRWFAWGCRGAEQTTEAWGERESALKPQLVVGRLGEESQGRQPESGNPTFRDDKGAHGKRGCSGSADLSKRWTQKGFGSTGGSARLSPWCARPGSTQCVSSLTEVIIHCIIEVHRALGPGFLESVYRRALVVERAPI